MTITTLTAVRALRAGRSRQRPSSPADLAKMLDPTFRIVPVTRLLSDIAVKAVEQPDQRDIVTCPPRSGKSRLLSIWTPVWALMRNPDMSIMVVSYSDEAACGCRGSAERAGGPSRSRISSPDECRDGRSATHRTPRRP